MVNGAFLVSNMTLVVIPLRNLYDIQIFNNNCVLLENYQKLVYDDDLTYNFKLLKSVILLT